MSLDKTRATIIKAQKFDQHLVSVGGGASQASIGAIETNLNVKFCEDYKQFLFEFGQLLISDDGICGIYSDDVNEVSSGTVLYETNQFSSRHSRNPNHTVLINHDDEYYDMIDHSSGQLISYDPFSDTYSSLDESLDDFVSNCISNYLDS